MRLVCPSCGATNSADGWLNDANCRQTMARIAALPAPLPEVAIGYLSLFRPGERGLSWKKALRLATEIGELVSKKYVHVQGRPDRDCGPRVWAAAMEQMIEQRNLLRLPMPNHRYLEKVAWDLADQADRASEYAGKQRQAARRSGPDDTPTPPRVNLSRIKSPMQAYIDGDRDTEPSQEEMSSWQRQQMGE